MINLLPNEAKRQIKAARTNIVLVRYIVVIVLSVIFLGVISWGTYTLLSNAKADAETTIAQNQAKLTSSSALQAQIQANKSLISATKPILDQEIAYTNVLTQIASIIPAGVVIDKISLSQTTFGTPLTLQAYARSNSNALNLVDSLQGSPFFSNVKMQSLTPTGTQNNGYPVSVILSVTISKAAAQ